MLSDIATFAGILALLLGVSLLHEATHYAVARLLGRAARFDPLDYAVHYESTPDVTWQDYAIAGAPVLIGVLAAPLIVIYVGVNLPIIIAWVIYTLMGAVTNDFDFERITREKPQTER